MRTNEHEHRAVGAIAEPGAPGDGLTDDEWAARFEALQRLANTDALSALEQAQAALEELHGQHRLDLESRLTGLVGHCYVRLERMVEGAVALHRAVGIAQAIGRIDIEVHHLATLGLAEAGLGAFSESIGCYERALSRHKSLPPSADNDLLRARVLVNFGSTYFYMGLIDKALSLYQQALDDFQRLGHARSSAVCLTNSAILHARRAERLSRQPSADARVQAVAAAREALALAEQVVADPSTEAQDEATINARLSVVKAHIVLGDCSAAVEELNQIDPLLTGDAQGSRYLADRSTLRSRLLRLSGRASEAIVELQAEPLDDMAHVDRVSVLEELIATQEAAGDWSGALASFRRYHELTLQARDQSAEQRGQVLNARLELERAQHKAEIERLRAERLTTQNTALERLATLDALTGLPNRRGLDAALEHRLGNERSRFACVMADIDHFKRINDCYSHPVGDEVLRRVGALMREVVRDGDVAARYGGEEFSLLLDRLDEPMALQVCERLRTAIASYPWGQIAGGLTVTVSLGVTMRRLGDNASALLERADTCLYAAKTAGRNRVMVEALDAAPGLVLKSGGNESVT
ncbi:MAG: diguanylate cyclase [Inhella sp.]|uniref:diguanylate cyclase n=1 Tax=Inhella sp. TaxID=1921806 RepID=UPI0022C72F72|nr:diguanylate cyclase [Polaromonas sp.]